MACVNCSASLVHAGKTSGFDFRYGETDLYEGNLRRPAYAYLIGILSVAAILVIVSVFIIGVSTLNALLGMDGAGINAVPISSFTPQNTIRLMTVTEGPPTATYTLSPSPIPSVAPSATQEPCIQRVGPGDYLLAIITRCGHRDLDVIDLVLEINNLSDPARIQEGQILEIPWPTPTPDPNAETTPSLDDSDSASSGNNGVEVSENPLFGSGDEPFDPFAPTSTATLQPGVMWHRVQAGDNIIAIAIKYGGNVEILSQLNPEVTFSQCDFGLDSGGASCTVFLAQGQLLRVPAPTPTPTVPPTATGSETPTPTPTATFNAPRAFSPDNRAFFEADQIVTLRWTATGILAPGQAYRVVLENLTTGVINHVDTLQLSTIIAEDWQGNDDRRYEYQWTVSVIDIENPDNPYFVTEARTFTWQGRQRSEN